MITSPLRALVLAPLALASVVACGAPPETTASTDEGINLIPIRKYVEPAWPVANPTYCPDVYPKCSVTEEAYADADTTNFPEDAKLRQLGCTPPLRLVTGTSNGLLAETLALCFDTPEVRATFDVVTDDTLLTCNTCMSQAPARQVYIYAGFAAVGPNCPSGCPGSGGGITHVGGSSGGTVNSQ